MVVQLQFTRRLPKTWWPRHAMSLVNEDRLATRNNDSQAAAVFPDSCRHRYVNRLALLYSSSGKKRQSVPVLN